MAEPVSVQVVDGTLRELLMPRLGLSSAPSFRNRARGYALQFQTRLGHDRREFMRTYEHSVVTFNDDDGFFCWVIHLQPMDR